MEESNFSETVAPGPQKSPKTIEDSPYRHQSFDSPAHRKINLPIPKPQNLPPPLHFKRPAGFEYLPTSLTLSEPLLKEEEEPLFPGQKRQRGFSLRRRHVSVFAESPLISKNQTLRMAFAAELLVFVLVQHFFLLVSLSAVGFFPKIQKVVRENNWIAFAFSGIYATVLFITSCLPPNLSTYRPVNPSNPLQKKIPYPQPLNIFLITLFLISRTALISSASVYIGIGVPVTLTLVSLANFILLLAYLLTISDDFEFSESMAVVSISSLISLFSLALFCNDFMASFLIILVGFLYAIYIVFDSHLLINSSELRLTESDVPTAALRLEVDFLNLVYEVVKRLTLMNKFI